MRVKGVAPAPQHPRKILDTVQGFERSGVGGVVTCTWAGQGRGGQGLKHASWRGTSFTTGVSRESGRVVLEGPP
eukprot:747783-Hanusia_phi.AAC.5